MNAFIKYSAQQMLATHLINARDAIDEVLDEVTSPADGDELGDAKLITKDLDKLLTLNVFAAYEGIPMSNNRAANLYLGSRHSTLKGAVPSLIVEFPETKDENAVTWCLDDASYLWNKVLSDVHTIYGMFYPERIMSLLDWKEAMDLRIANAARK